MNEFAQKIAQYNASLPAFSDEDFGELQIDANGRLIVTTSGQALDVSATDLDIRDLTHVSDSVQVGDGTEIMLVNADGSINAVVSATDLDIRDLSHTQDSIQIGDGTEILLVNADGSINAAVTATDLDIRDLDHTTDSVSIGDGTDVLDILVDDAARAGGEKGILPLAVRNDVAGTLVSADGDWTPLQVDADGALRISGALNAEVDDVFESGTESDANSDSAGDGVVAINNTGMTDLVTIAVGAGESLFITGMDFSADEQAWYQLIVDDNGTPSEFVRAGGVNGLIPDNKTFPRAIEITGAADRSVILRARAISDATANASGAINAYKR